MQKGLQPCGFKENDGVAKIKQNLRKFQTESVQSTQLAA